MTIGVDCGALSVTDPRLKVGVYRIIYNFLQTVKQVDAVNTYRLYSFRPLDAEIVSTIGERVKNIVLTEKGFFSLWLPLTLRRRPVDVFLGMAQALPISFQTKSHNIGFIYDLGFLYHPDAYRQSAVTLKKQTIQLVSRANHIVTTSWASAADIGENFSLPAEQVSVCYPGVDKSFTRFGQRYQHPRPYFLFVGSLNKAKDLPFAITAFAQFLRKIKKPYDFLLIGGEFWPDPNIDRAIKKNEIASHVIKCGVVSDSQLPQYYRGATALVATGLHEGFCLPVTEAQSCGVPVLAVGRGALPETVGRGGLVTASGDSASLVQSMYQIATDHELTRKLKVLAVKNAAKYSWTEFTKRVVRIISRYEH